MAWFIKLFFDVIKQMSVSTQRELDAASAFEAMFHKHFPVEIQIKMDLD